MAKGNCTIEGCAKRAFARGWCKGHLYRFYTYGDPLGQPVRPSFQERLWAKVNKDGPIPEYAPHLGPCWVWTGKPDAHGYATIRRDGKTIKAHRGTYEEIIGPFPEGLVPDHLCRVTMCVNPHHLEPVTQRENSLRGIRTAPSVCPHGHEYTEANTRIKKNGTRVCRSCEVEFAGRRRPRRDLTSPRVPTLP